MRQARTDLPVLVVSGLAAEARIAAGPGNICVAAPPSSLAAELEAAVTGRDFSAVVSFGLAGGLRPGLRAGTLIVADAILAGGDAWQIDSEITGKIRNSLGDHSIRVLAGAIAACDAPVMTATDKQALQRRTGAVAVDTESHFAAGFAARRALPFAAIRAVCDTAESDLPPLAVHAIGGDGRLDFAAIGQELLARPGQLLALPGTALATAKAMRTLRRVRRRLGPRLGF